jgi:hypothetical protein
MTTKPQDENEFRTSDLYFAAYLQTAGVAMLRTDRNGSGKVQFIFDTSMSNLPELKNAWVNQSGKVVAMAYANNIKNLKSICHMT